MSKQSIDDSKFTRFEVLAIHQETRELIGYIVDAENKDQAFDKAAVEAGDLVHDIEFIACAPEGLLYCPSGKPVIGDYYLD